MKRLFTVLGVAVLVTAAVVAGWLGYMRTATRTPEADYQKTMDKVQRLVDGKRHEEAVAVLDQFAGKRRDTPWELKALEARTKLVRGEAARTLKERCLAFGEAAREKSLPKVMAFIHPDVRKGPQGATFEARLSEGLERSGSRAPIERLVDIQLDPDGRSAVVRFQLTDPMFASSGVKRQPRIATTYWRKADGEWYLTVHAPASPASGTPAPLKPQAKDPATPPPGQPLYPEKPHR